MPVASELGIYVCPACKQALNSKASVLRCGVCDQSYRIDAGIPDFLGEELSESKDPELRRMATIDRMARIYETKLWYPIVLNIYGGFRSRSLAQIVEAVSNDIQSAEGRVLDVACGPGTYGRRIASPAREVFGIDISKRMLRQGAAYMEAEGASNVHFARARVEALPFEGGIFDAAICCGSLHLFADTAVALREIARVMKPSAILSVFTFTAGRRGILKFRSVRERHEERHGLHIFDIPEMKQTLTESGFEDFQPEVYGSILMFRARKQSA